MNLFQTVSRESWRRILSLARFYGWQPMGTLPPLIYNLRGLVTDDRTYGIWDGTYLRNEGQLVRMEDAVSLAAALEISLDDIPDENIDWHDLGPEEADDLPEWLSPEEKARIRNGLEEHWQGLVGVLPFEYFAGDAKQGLAEFIQFCSLGEFVIS